MTYTGPEFRSFSMNWTLIPTDSSEAGTIHRIAKFFKKFTLPNKRGIAGSSYFEMPPTFDVEMKIHAQGDSNAIDLFSTLYHGQYKCINYKRDDAMQVCCVSYY